MSRILLEGLTKIFRAPRGGEVKALDHVDLAVDEGEMVVLLGPSGCGKTTMLRCLAGLEQPTSGVIEIGDHMVFASERRVNVPPDKRKLGMVFQSYALWPHKTVAHNVGYPLRRQHVPASDIETRVNDALEQVDCGHLADRYPHELSGGQQQRVALARALVARPRLLLFDEPLSNLDAGLRDRMRTEIRNVQRGEGYTSVYVTHDQREAMAIADRLLVMSEGRILQAGAPEDVYRRPTTRFVAEFLGAANRIPVDRRTGRGEVETPLGTLHVTPGDEAWANEDIDVIVRQESLTLVGHDEATTSNVIDVDLRDVEFLGDHRLATFNAKGIVLHAKLPPSTPLSRGDSYRIAFKTEDAIEVRRAHT